MCIMLMKRYGDTEIIAHKVDLFTQYQKWKCRPPSAFDNIAIAPAQVDVLDGVDTGEKDVDDKISDEYYLLDTMFQIEECVWYITTRYTNSKR